MKRIVALFLYLPLTACWLLPNAAQAPTPSQGSDSRLPKTWTQAKAQALLACLQEHHNSTFNFWLQEFERDEKSIRELKPVTAPREYQQKLDYLGKSMAEASVSQGSSEDCFPRVAQA
ncbi:MAG: hypothetical protein ACAI44_13035 [Candidatus Sericytochromatia bacterium]